MRALSVIILLWMLALAEGAVAQDGSWAEWRHTWERQTITVRTNAGVYSPSIQGGGKAAPRSAGRPTPEQLMATARAFFVMTSAPRVDHTFEFMEPLARQWGHGHALPIISAVALENVQRPMPSVFGGPLTAMTHEMTAASAAGIDPSRLGSLTLVVHGDVPGFRRAAARVAHASAKAYFDPARGEVGLLLDMDRFRRFYGRFEREPQRQPSILSAFIAYTMDAFNEDSSHELAHAMQHQTGRLGYALPAVREGEAEVQGLVRRRNGLTFNFLYNTPDAWYSGKFDRRVLDARLTAIQQFGRPMHPFEVDRLGALQALQRAGGLIPAGRLLGMDAPAFFLGTPAEVESRYAQAWALCLLAIREKPAGELLRQAIDGRVRAAPRLDVEARLDQLYAAFIQDPWKLKVTKAQVWADAERFYGIDKIFAGAVYAWAYVVDPTEVKSLVYLGDALFAAANWPAALQQYESAQRRHERSALPMLRIGDVYAQMGEPDQARQRWQQAMDSRAEGPDEQAYRTLAKQRLAALPR